MSFVEDARARLKFLPFLARLHAVEVANVARDAILVVESFLAVGDGALVESVRVVASSPYPGALRRSLVRLLLHNHRSLIVLLLHDQRSLVRLSSFVFFFLFLQVRHK